MGTVSIFDEGALNVVVDTNDCVLGVLTLKSKSRQIYNGGKIKCYNDPDAFLRDLEGFPPSTNFFFGAYYGVGSDLTGADLAKAVKSRDRSSPVFIVTTALGAPSIVEAHRTGIVDAIFPKELYITEPHDNGQLTPEENEKFFSNYKILSPDSKFKIVFAFLEKRGQCLEEISRARKRREMASKVMESPKGMTEEASNPSTSTPQSSRVGGMIGILTRLMRHS